jgi:transposase
MPAKSIPTQTIRNIITLRALSHLSCRELSTLFDVAASTVGTYLSAFERSVPARSNGGAAVPLCRQM